MMRKKWKPIERKRTTCTGPIVKSKRATKFTNSATRHAAADVKQGVKEAEDKAVAGHRQMAEDAQRMAAAGSDSCTPGIEEVQGLASNSKTPANKLDVQQVQWEELDTRSTISAGNLRCRCHLE
ncbi:hypothetical protein cyc_04154 [Cyclospora cayetanensis]|uniref:Uncharacterized protein n=1 Tax=Cyclospora cayetanensis TaxID=88456 RepID=A0A1D3CWS9_9EIME|nr:hypothetical protein cyc_04154 [Cyclospora cayetanensis]